MLVIDLPIFLDCEASSLSNDSYPIEIAWSDETGEIEAHLINVYAYPEDYTDWDPSAQHVHGLSRNYLSCYGENPFDVAKRMNYVLSGKQVYSDAPDFDGFWVDRLYGAVGMKREFSFAYVESLLRKLLPVEYWVQNPTSGNIPLEKLKGQARKEVGLEAHRAGNDVAYLLELYKISRRAAGYYI